MSRGESAKPGERAPGIAIFAVVGVVALAGLFVVLWSTGLIGDVGSWFSYGSPPPEPFPGAEAAMAQLGWRGCLRSGGPALGPVTPTQSDLESFAVERGYVGEGAWGEPVALPWRGTVPELVEECGVVVVSAEAESALTRATRTGSLPEVACSGLGMLVGACGGDVLALEGTGSVRLRSFALPGLTPSAVTATGLPLDVALGHAEAERTLGALGWTASEEVAEVRVLSSAGTSQNVAPPETPSSGCVAFVGVSYGVGRNAVYWNHGMRQDEATDRGISGVVACTPTVWTGASVQVNDADGAGGAVYFRAYAVHQGPSVAVGAPPVLVVPTLRLLASDAGMTLPTAVPSTPLEP